MEKNFEDEKKQITEWDRWSRNMSSNTYTSYKRPDLLMDNFDFESINDPFYTLAIKNDRRNNE